MSLEAYTLKRGGDVIFAAGIPAAIWHITLPQIYMFLGIVWIGWEILSAVVSAVHKWLSRRR